MAQVLLPKMSASLASVVLGNTPCTITILEHAHSARSHFGVMFAAGMGANVTAISHSERKKDDAIKLGAKNFIVTGDLYPDLAVEEY